MYGSLLNCIDPRDGQVQLLEVFHGGFRSVRYLKHFIQLGDLEYFKDGLGYIAQVKLTVLHAHSIVASDEHSKRGRGQVIHSTE